MQRLCYLYMCVIAFNMSREEDVKIYMYICGWCIISISFCDKTACCDCCSTAITTLVQTIHVQNHVLSKKKVVIVKWNGNVIYRDRMATVKVRESRRNLNDAGGVVTAAYLDLLQLHFHSLSPHVSLENL